MKKGKNQLILSNVSDLLQFLGATPMNSLRKIFASIFRGDTYEQFEENSFIEWARMGHTNAFLGAQTDLFYTQVQRETRKHSSNTITVN